LKSSTNTENQLKPDGSAIKNDEWEWLSDAVFVKLVKSGKMQTF